MAADTGKAIDELYSLPIEEFVRRRDELARALRAEGERELAEETKRLRKPSVAAWTVNQLARREQKAVSELLEAGKRLRNAHEQLLGGGSADELQRASTAERNAVRVLVKSAESVLREAGSSATSGTLERVRETLHAASLDEHVAELVRAGRVTSDEQAAGFGLDVLAAVPPAKPPPRRAAAAEARDERRRREDRDRLEAAEKRLREARTAVDEAKRAAAERARELERAERELETVRRGLERAEREVETARARVRSD